jgi:redox-sensing transcriptional repressor
VPSGVDVRKVDLSIELQILAFHAQRRGAGAALGNGSRDATSSSRRLESVPTGDLSMMPGPDRPTHDYTTGVQAVGT